MWRCRNRFLGLFSVTATFGTASIGKVVTKAGRTGSAIVAAIRQDEAGETRVLILPMTHSPPDPASLAVEIPAATERRLNLDDERSWVILSEWNEFVWPGPDLRRLPGSDDASVAYGMLPPALFAAIGTAFLHWRKGATPGACRAPERHRAW